jgi:preprotein translocase subunit YajC
LSPEKLPFLAFLPTAMSPPAEGGGQSSPWSMVTLFVPFLLIFYFLLWRPQAKRQKEHQKMLDALQKGDRIVTSGGLHATVLNVKEEEKVVVATIAEGVKVEIARASVAGVVQNKKK